MVGLRGTWVVGGGRNISRLSNSSALDLFGRFDGMASEQRDDVQARIISPLRVPLSLFNRAMVRFRGGKMRR